jgi:hypothetical protein
VGEVEVGDDGIIVVVGHDVDDALIKAEKFSTSLTDQWG